MVDVVEVVDVVVVVVVVAIWIQFHCVGKYLNWEKWIELDELWLRHRCHGD